MSKVQKLRQLEKYQRFEHQLEVLEKDYGFKRENITVMWSCQWTALKQKCPDVAKFLEKPLRPLDRLVAQDAVRAQLTESTVFKWDQADDKNLRGCNGDINSLFPFIAMTHSWPVGRYQRLVGDQLDMSKLRFTQDEFYYDNVAYMGLIQLRIAPPADLDIPFLLTHVNGQSVAVLCKTCAEKTEQESPCPHNEFERSLLGTYTTAEVNFAICILNYKLLDCFELLLYSERAPIYSKFVALLAFNRLRCSPVDKHLTPQQHCDTLNKHMEFESRLGKLLSPGDICPNPQMSVFYKKSVNSLIGVMSTNLENRTTTYILDDQDQLQTFAAEDRIKDVVLVENSSYCQVTVTGGRQTNEDCLEDQVSRKSNSCVGALLTSLARVYVYSEMLKIKQSGGQILKIACDALYYCLPSQCLEPLEYAPSFGRWKRIYDGEMKSLLQVTKAQLCKTAHSRIIFFFWQVGINNYAVVWKTAEGTLETEAKVSGLKLSHMLTNDVTADLYSDTVDRLLQDKVFNFKKKKMHNIRQIFDKKTFTLCKKRRPHTVFSRNILSRRAVIGLKDGFRTKPYGWTT
jgi:DNA-binding ferritin-like protein (Dps family)